MDNKIDCIFDNILYFWSGMSEYEYKAFKGLSESEDLGDNMSELELTFDNMAMDFASIFTQIIKPTTMEDYAEIALHSGYVAKAALKEFEELSGIKVVTPMNAKDFARRDGEPRDNWLA